MPSPFGSNGSPQSRDNEDAIADAPQNSPNAGGYTGTPGRTAENTDATTNEANRISRWGRIVDVDTDPRDIELSLNSFPEATKLVIKELMMKLARPFLYIWLKSFKVRVIMISQSENDHKVTAMMTQMEDLMRAFLNLPHIINSEEKYSIGQRLKDLAIEVQSDMERCASDCDAYLKKGKLMKIIKSNDYNIRLSGYAMRFSEHRIKLEAFLAVHTSKEVHSVHQKLDDQAVLLMDLREKMVALQQKLDTPLEKKIKEFIQRNSGPDACISDKQLLNELIDISGEFSSQLHEQDAGCRTDELPRGTLP